VTNGLVGFGFMVFNTTFNNISDIPWRSVLTSKPPTYRRHSLTNSDEYNMNVCEK
jgi:hypothetical protein